MNADQVRRIINQAFINGISCHKSRKKNKYQNVLFQHLHCSNLNQYFYCDNYHSLGINLEELLYYSIPCDLWKISRMVNFLKGNNS